MEIKPNPSKVKKSDGASGVDDLHFISLEFGKTHVPFP